MQPTECWRHKVNWRCGTVGINILWCNFSYKSGTLLLILWDAKKKKKNPILTGWVVLLIPYAVTSSKKKKNLNIYKKVGGSLTATLFYISLILVQKDTVQIIICWSSLVAWLVLVIHVIMLGNVDQYLSFCLPDFVCQPKQILSVSLLKLPKYYTQIFLLVPSSVWTFMQLLKKNY